MSPPPGARRALLAVAAALLGLSLAALVRGRAPVATAVPDDPALELRVDLNAAGAAELEALPGIGPALAGRILEARDRGGGFRRLEDLLAVPGIGERTLERLRGWVALGDPGAGTAQQRR